VPFCAGSFCPKYTQPNATGIRDRIIKAFDDDEAARMVLGIHESGLARKRVAFGTDRVTAKASRTRFLDAISPFESDAVNATEDLVFAGRCRVECNQVSGRLRSLQPSEISRSIDGGTRVEMTHRIAAHFGVFALAMARRIGLNAEFGSGNTHLQPA
jgi:hypothetical protein